jgi:hypothetical protein
MKKKTPKFAVFVNDGFDSMFDDNEEAKAYAKEVRDDARRVKYRKVSARVFKLTKYDLEAFGIL